MATEEAASEVVEVSVVETVEVMEEVAAATKWEEGWLKLFCFILFILHRTHR